MNFLNYRSNQMGMTHYMELMMGSWQLLVLFMAVPMFLAECYVVSEVLLLLEGQKAGAGLHRFNRFSAWASAVVILLLALVAGWDFLHVAEWRGWVDEAASAAYVLAGLPFIAVALVEGGILMRNADAVRRGKACVTAVVAYLLLAHAAMVFGMIDPMQFGWQPAPGAMNHHMTGHGMMNHGGHDHAMPHDMPMMPEGAHCDHGMPEHAPAGTHVMPDGTVMRNDAMSGAECPHMAGHGVPPSSRPEEGAVPSGGHHHCE